MRRTMIPLIWVVTTLVLSGLPGAAPANTTIQLCPPSLFDALDTNGDEKIALQEYTRLIRDKESAGKNFRALDQDRNGYLQTRDAQALFTRLDQDRDGLLNQKELMLRWQKASFRSNLGKAAEDLEILDFNRDGAVAFEEFSRNWVGLALVVW